MKICLYVYIYIFLLSFVYNKLISHNLYMFLDSLHLPNVTLCYILCTNHKLKSEKKKTDVGLCMVTIFHFFSICYFFYVVNDLLKIILLTFFYFLLLYLMLVIKFLFTIFLQLRLF